MAILGQYGNIGYGTYLTFKGNTYCVQSIEGPSTEIPDDIEITHSCSTAKQYVPGILDNGELTMEILFDPQNPVVPDRTTNQLVVVFPRKDPLSPVVGKFICQAFVKSAPVSVPNQDKMTQSVTFRLTGAGTWVY